jgi:predicted nucleic acid-binding protein
VAIAVIAADASVVIAWLNWVDCPEVRALKTLVSERSLIMPGAALTETLSSPNLADADRFALSEIPVLPVREDYWVRAGHLRGAVLRMGRRVRLGDALIAQACIDADVPLLTRDADFRVFAEVGGLKLYEG